MGQRVIQRKFLCQRMLTGGFQMADNHLLIKVHIWCATTLGTTMQEVGIEAGQDEELVRALHMNEEALMRTGILQGFDLVNTVEAFQTMSWKLLLSCGRKPEVRTHDGDVVRHL